MSIPGEGGKNTTLMGGRKTKMLKLLRNFWKEESGMGTVEIVLIIAALVAVALIFKDAIINFVQDAIDKIFNNAKDGVN